MAKTTEQKQAEFETLMAENGFITDGLETYDGRPIYHRKWIKEVEAIWYGKQESHFEIWVDSKYGMPMAQIYKNGRLEGRRNYSSPKRAINALKDITSWAGFEF